MRQFKELHIQKRSQGLGIQLYIDFEDDEGPILRYCDTPEHALQILGNILKQMASQELLNLDSAIFSPQVFEWP